MRERDGGWEGENGDWGVGAEWEVRERKDIQVEPSQQPDLLLLWTCGRMGGRSYLLGRRRPLYPFVRLVLGLDL